jgi:ribosomal protein S8E
VSTLTLNLNPSRVSLNFSQYLSSRRKRTARESHKSSAVAQKLYGIKAKLHHAKRHAEKVQLKKTLKAHDERNVKQADDSAAKQGALPTYLLDREGQKDAKALSSSIKERRKDKAAKYSVPLPKVRGIAEEEMFKVIKTGSKKSKSWKRMVNKATFVGEGFTRKPVKMERFIRPMALRYKKANVTHREWYTVGLAWWFEEQGLMRPLLASDSRPQGHLPVAYYWSQEEPPVATIHAVGCHDQGNHRRGQRQRVGYGDHRRKGCLGE